MVQRKYDIDLVFSALADPTRRKVIEMLCKEPASVSELSSHFGMAMPSFMQHLNILENSGIITSEKKGRVRICYLNSKALLPMEHWLSEQKNLWEKRLNQLDSYLERMKRM
ncbi:metalloregulator ArsR/SmtB family transcription factor [Leptospira sp. 96542]|nr:metalloregulator ArsR/SmtB family transcription factor [Leptospira sp. 96542]